MRTFGIIAVFLLALAAVGEGAYLIRLSSKIEDLEQRVAAGATEPPERVLLPRTRHEAAFEPAPRRLTPAPAVPRLQPAAAPTPATAALGDALTTPEGREHLKAALDVIREEARRERLIVNAERAVQREQRYKERVFREVPLTGDEPARIEAMFATLQANRQRVLGEMRAGQKNSEQADDEIDRYEDETERAMRALLGEQRWTKLREAARQQRRQQQQQQPPVATQAR